MRIGAKTHQKNIYTVKPDGSDLFQVTSTGLQDFGPDWGRTRSHTRLNARPGRAPDARFPMEIRKHLSYAVLVPAHGCIGAWPVTKNPRRPGHPR